MDQYTQMLDDEAATLSPDDDYYEEKLLEVARSFRTFSEALTQFVCDNGYEGADDDTDGKLAFLKSKFKSAKVSVPREIDEWFISGKTIKRDTAFQLCFAFGLNVEQTNEFFKKVWFGRSFDCHSIKEAVYYYCVRNGLSYEKAATLISRLPKDSKGKIDTENEVLYTGSIVDFINSAKSEDELIDYITEHFEQFGYNNATAKKHIGKLWDEISCDNGLAYKEGIAFDKTNNQYHLISESSDDDFVTAPEKNASTWAIYSQIMGLDKHQADEYKANRSIKPLLANNSLLPTLAQASFPDRDGIEKITNGQHVSHERIRKLLILLEFYSHWARLIVEKKSSHYNTTRVDSERCVDKINRYLLDCGYPELYAGNPYDWIFLWAVNDDINPLLAFREYMREIFIAE